MKCDFLITTWNCQDCAKLKLRIKEEAIYDDYFVGKDGQILVVVNVFSNSAAEAVLEKLGLPEEAITPAILTQDNTPWWEFNDVVRYLEDQGFLNAEET